MKNSLADNIASLRKLGYRTMTAVLGLTTVGLVIASFAISTLISLQDLSLAAQKNFDNWRFLADRARLLLEARKPQSSIPTVVFLAKESYQQAYEDAENEGRRVDRISAELDSVWTAGLFERGLLREFREEHISPELKREVFALSGVFDSPDTADKTDYTQLAVALSNDELLSPLYRRTVLASVMAQQCLRPVLAVLAALATGYLLGLWLLWRRSLSPAFQELIRRNEQVLEAQRVANLCCWFSYEGEAPDFSPGSARLLGLDASSLPASLEDCARLSPADDAERIGAIYSRLAHHDGVREVTRRIVSPEYGERVFRERVLSRVIGGQRQLMGIMFDVSDLTRASEGWANAEKIRLIELVTAGVAHDFNNILGIVRGHAELMLHRKTFSEAGLKAIMDATDTAVSIIAKLRSRVSFSNLSVQTFSASEAIADCAKSLRALTAMSCDIDVVCDTRMDFIVRCNRGLFDNAMVNMLKNAIEASPANSTVTIGLDVLESVDAVLKGDEVASLAPASRYGCITIRDWGAGMSEDVCRRAFEPFFSTKERGAGAKARGLGLWSVLTFMQNVNGALHVTSKLGEGTQVVLVFPLGVGEVGSVREGTERALSSGLTGRKVLVVEDETEARAVISEMLRHWGAHPLLARDAEEASHILARGKPPDLMIADVDLGHGANGLELADSVRRKNPNMRIIIMSGLLTRDEFEARHGRDYTFIEKPFSFSVLRQALAGGMAKGDRENAL